jgi:hypothetical protein
LPRLVTDHKFILREKDTLLLRHREAAVLELQPIAAGELRFGVERPIPASRGAIWARFDASLSWLGVLRRFLYKPPEVKIVVREKQGDVREFRLVLPAARAGFLLSPLLLNTEDLERLVTRREGRVVQSVKLEIRGKDKAFFRKRVLYELAALPALGIVSDPRP